MRNVSASSGRVENDLAEKRRAFQQPVRHRGVPHGKTLGMHTHAAQGVGKALFGAFPTPWWRMGERLPAAPTVRPRACPAADAARPRPPAGKRPGSHDLPARPSGRDVPPPLREIAGRSPARQQTGSLVCAIPSGSDHPGRSRPTFPSALTTAASYRNVPSGAGK